MLPKDFILCYNALLFIICLFLHRHNYFTSTSRAKHSQCVVVARPGQEVAYDTLREFFICCLYMLNSYDSADTSQQVINASILVYRFSGKNTMLDVF